MGKDFWNNKTVNTLVKEINAITDSPEFEEDMTEEEIIEYDSEFGYSDDDD